MNTKVGGKTHSAHPPDSKIVRLLSLARDLKRRRGRERQGLFVVEGVRAVEELLRSPIRVRGVLHSPATDDGRRARLIENLRGRGVPTLAVATEDLESAADTESPQGVLAVAEVPSTALADLAIGPHARLCVLDGLQDPGNVGTIVRTAAALGARATLALPGTVDLWNAKVVRSSMGALFNHPAIACSWADLDAFVARTSVDVWAADAAGDPLPARDARPPRLALVLGNEGAGLSPEARTRVRRSVALPLDAGIESLNVAVAAGILLHELRP